jgi:hypothetical protein
VEVDSEALDVRVHPVADVVFEPERDRSEDVPAREREDRPQRSETQADQGVRNQAIGHPRLEHFVDEALHDLGLGHLRRQNAHGHESRQCETEAIGLRVWEKTS